MNLENTTPSRAKTHLETDSVQKLYLIKSTTLEVWGVFKWLLPDSVTWKLQFFNLVIYKGKLSHWKEERF